MAQERTATLTMRRSIEAIRNTGTTESQNLHFEEQTLKEVIESVHWSEYSLEEGQPVDVSSFRDAVAVASLFYGLREPFKTVFPGTEQNVKTEGTGSEEEILLQTEEPQPSEKTRHPIVAWALGTTGIMWFTIRHPGKPAWIDHNTGEVWVAD